MNQPWKQILEQASKIDVALRDCPLSWPVKSAVYSALSELQKISNTLTEESEDE